MLVDKWTISNDRLTYTFTLRKGVKFHNGKDLTSEDVKASLERWGRIAANGRAMFANVVALTAADPLTVVLRLGEPNGLVLMYLGLKVVKARYSSYAPTMSILEVDLSFLFVVAVILIWFMIAYRRRGRALLDELAEQGEVLGDRLTRQHPEARHPDRLVPDERGGQVNRPGRHVIEEPIALTVGYGTECRPINPDLGASDRRSRLVPNSSFELTSRLSMQRTR